MKPKMKSKTKISSAECAPSPAQAIRVRWLDPSLTASLLVCTFSVSAGAFMLPYMSYSLSYVAGGGLKPPLHHASFKPVAEAVCSSWNSALFHLPRSPRDTGKPKAVTSASTTRPKYHPGLEMMETKPYLQWRNKKIVCLKWDCWTSKGTFDTAAVVKAGVAL